MHELSIASGIVEMAVEEAERRQVRVNAIYLKLGPLSGVVKEALLGAWELAVSGTPLERSRLIVDDVQVSAFCQSCREERIIPSMQWLCCPVCGTPTPDIRQGADLEVTALEVEP